MVGKTVSHYRVLEKLGGGGMGVVYRAADLKLGREVALKFLSDELARDRTAVERFRREARSAAALNHPNLCTIYEVGEHEGHPFIAMELLTGETLRQRISGKPVPADSLVRWATQITEGLEAAHQRGIIHRDIKPANLFVNEGGQVKILDFGLAKPAQAGASARAAASERTLTMAVDALSTSGTLSGTPDYMSPEQARGDALDARTDLFSLGTVLYEMATGKRPFRGQTSAAVISAILEGNPEPPSWLNPDLPAELDRIIGKALKKDRNLRYQSAAEMRAGLRGIQPKSDMVLAAAAPIHERTTDARTDSTPVPPAAVVSPRALVLIAVVTILAAAGFVLYRAGGAKKTALPFQTMSIERLTNAGEVRQAAISPDGKYVAYVVGDEGNRSLWVRQVDTHRDIQILEPKRGVSCCLTFSQDGNYIYFVGNDASSESSQLFQLPTLGGAPRKMGSSIGTRISFAPDGRRFAFVRETSSAVTALLVSDLDGAEPRQIAERKVPDPFSLGGPVWSPDGKWIASGAYAGGRCFVVVAPAVGGPVMQVGKDGWLHVGRISWLADSAGLVVTAQQSSSSPWQIWQISYPEGQVRRITNDLTDYRDVSLTADSATLVALQSDLQSSLWMAPEGASARATQISSGVGTQDGYFGLTWTPDGRILYASRAGGTREIWVMNVDGSDRKQLTWGANLTFFSSPAVCPDGHTVVYASGHFGAANIWKIDLDGSKPVPLTQEGTNGAPSCSPDGKWVVFNSWRGGELMLWKTLLEGGPLEQITDFASAYPVVSPDGKWIAFENESSRSRNYLGVIPFTGGQPAKTFDNSYSYPAGHPVFHWTAGGRALDYIDTRAGVSNIWRQPLSGGQPRQITNFPSGQIFNLSWSPDGKLLVLARGTSASDAVLIRNGGPS